MRAWQKYSCVADDLCRIAKRRPSIDARFEGKMLWDTRVMDILAIF